MSYQDAQEVEVTDEFLQMQAQKGQRDQKIHTDMVKGNRFRVPRLDLIQHRAERISVAIATRRRRAALNRSTDAIVFNDLFGQDPEDLPEYGLGIA